MHVFEIIWLTRNIKSLFSLKDKNHRKSHVVYEGQCNCGAKYIGETQGNVTINEHEDATKISEPARH